MKPDTEHTKEATKASTSNARKQKRLKFWKNKIKQDASNSETKKASSEKKALRNRDTISKPDTLKYERPINRGFQARALSQFAPESKRRDRAAKAASPPKSPSKQKSESQANGKSKSPKKVKPAEDYFDSYKFSMDLINGEVSPAKTEVAKQSDQYVLFIGNLPYDINREQLEEHFKKTRGIKAIRIPRKKGTDEGKGFAYMEFDSRIAHGIALRLHQTTLCGRKINVEFTTIGGGKSKARKEKIKAKNRKLSKMKMNF